MKKLLLVCLLIGIINGCSVKRFLVYEPTSANDIFTYYSNGIPINSISTDDAFILFAVDETELFSKAYLRVWLLFENTDSVAYILEPYNFLTLYAERDNDKFSDFYAESPTRILNAIDEQKAVTMVFQAIGGTLEAMNVDGTRIKSNTGVTYQVNDRNISKFVLNVINQCHLDISL